jgi:hypothetical protein
MEFGATPYPGKRHGRAWCTISRAPTKAHQPLRQFDTIHALNESRAPSFNSATIDCLSSLSPDDVLYVTFAICDDDTGNRYL